MVCGLLLYIMLRDELGKGVIFFIRRLGYGCAARRSDNLF
jgi:hypothetical protein